jgi:hypothetical protein
MSALLRLTKALLSSLPSLPSQSVQDEAYLADSCDIYELEWRMRELDKRRIAPPWDVTYGFAKH